MRHEFIEVGERRWCVKCDLFQTARGQQWVPISFECSGLYNPQKRTAADFTCEPVASSAMVSAAGCPHPLTPAH